MSEPNQPKPPRKGQFQKGNKLSKGRPKGAENKFGPGFREKLIAGIIASGEKKARKNGVNGKVDGFAYFVENLVDGNGGAAATLIAKMLPSEPAPASFTGPAMVVNVSAAAEGQIFLPGNEVLAPFEFAREAWLAFNAGSESWKTYLETIKGRFTAEAFANLASVEASDRKVPALEPVLRLVPTDGDAAAQVVEPLLSEEERQLVELIDRLKVIVTQHGFDPRYLDLDPRLLSSSDGNDAA